jgi:4'-phosphopantetheinyl transferase
MSSVEAVRVYVIAADVERAEDQGLLSAEERESAARFHFERDRRLYTAAHAGLRRALARELGADPREFAFAADAAGRPHLLGTTGLFFSLSHSGDRALVAVARTPRLGVDVEWLRAGIDRERLAQRNFTPREQAELLALPEEERYLGFFRVWTRKEAYVKALGKGLYHPLADFDVSASLAAHFLAFRDGSRLSDWSLCDLDLGPGRAGALAIERGAAAVELVADFVS